MATEAVVRDDAAILRQIRQGDELALLAWADRLEETGDAEGAEAVRGWHPLAEVLKDEIGELRLRRHLRYRNRVVLGWDVDERWTCFSISGNVDGISPAIRPVLDAPDKLLPAVEWLARQLYLPMVELEFFGSDQEMASVQESRCKSFSLNRGQVLRLPPGSNGVAATLYAPTTRKPRKNP
jgi:hypothetical protein